MIPPPRMLPRGVAPEPAMPFTLSLKDARTLKEGQLEVYAAMTVAELKGVIGFSGFAERGARLHVAHAGRMLGDAETLEALVHAPSVVVVSLPAQSFSVP
eukprot:564938-Prymnesium_polylepis.1